MPKMTFIEKNGQPREVDAPLGLSVLEIAHKHGGAEACFGVDHVMRDAETVGDGAGVADVAPGAAGALAAGSGAVVVELQRDADDLVAGFGEQPGDH